MENFDKVSEFLLNNDILSPAGPSGVSESTITPQIQLETDDKYNNRKQSKKQWTVKEKRDFLVNIALEGVKLALEPSNVYR